MKNRIFNSCLILIVVVILCVFALYVRVGATADAVVVLRTSGMTCGSCIAQVSKALQSEKGVAATEVDLEGGWVIAGYDSKLVAPEKLARSVSATGYHSKVQMVLTPEQFRKMAGRDIGQQSAGSGCGCCN